MIALLNSPIFPMHSDGFNNYLTLHVELCMVIWGTSLCASSGQVYAEDMYSKGAMHIRTMKGRDMCTRIRIRGPSLESSWRAMSANLPVIASRLALTASLSGWVSFPFRRRRIRLVE